MKTTTTTQQPSNEPASPEHGGLGRRGFMRATALAAAGASTAGLLGASPATAA
jgi:hypothetical protein